MESKFHKEFTKLYNEITNEIYNTNTNDKWTIYLWDNVAMIEFIKHQLSTRSLTKSSINQKLNEILNTIKNHFVKFHHTTQSILKNSNHFKIESFAKAQHRYSTLNLEYVKS